MRACPQCLTVYEGDPEFCAFDGARTAVFVDDADPLAGLALDRYTLERRLGVGGTGCVYRARAPDGQLVAIKLLYGEMATDKSLALRFRREADAMRRIDHPNVVKVVDTRTSAAGLTYLVMEYVEGGTLKGVIEREAPLAPGRVGRLTEQLVAGLARAHHLGYVHRDLKPSNVMVSGHPGAEVAKILDFGIVASLRADEPDSRLTKTGYIVGTPTYMAPEQVDPKQVTPQADVYALGVMLYEMLAGEPPFTGTLEQILVAKMTSTPPALAGVGELGPFVARLLAMDPAERPASALHVSAELSRMSLLSPDPATERARAWELPDLADVGFGPRPAASGDRTDETPLPGRGGPDTRTAPTALDDETPEAPYSAFDDAPEALTTAAPRPDTLIDPTGRRAPQTGGSASAPTKPATGPDATAPSDALDRTELDDGGDGPTRVAAVSGFGVPGDFPDDTPVDRDTDADPTTGEMVGALDGTGPDATAGPYIAFGPFGADRERPASEASARRADGVGQADVSSRPRVAVFDRDASPLGSAATEIDAGQVHDTTVDDGARVDFLPSVAALGDAAPAEGEGEDDGGFADTRIRPSHLGEGTAREGSAPRAIRPAATRPVSPGQVTVRPVPSGGEAAAAPVALARRYPPRPVIAAPEASGDGTRPALEADAGDADTALDLVLEERVGGVSTDLAVDAGAAEPGPTRRPSWRLGLLVVGAVLVAAVTTYAVLDARSPVVIESPDSIESQ